MTVRHREEPAEGQADLAVDRLGPVHERLVREVRRGQQSLLWRAARPTNEADPALTLVGVVADIELRATLIKLSEDAERLARSREIPTTRWKGLLSADNSRAIWSSKAPIRGALPAVQ
jgi:hypothetical protein